MNKTKIFSIAILLSVTSITVLMHYGGQLGNRSTLCTTTVLSSLMPWDSACFYKSIFEKGSTTEEVYYEKYRLDLFTERGGLAPGTLWYRSNFYRIYKNVFDVDEATIDRYHWAYQSSQPNEIKELAFYIKYVSNHSGVSAGQAVLDKYCDKYLANTRFKKESYRNISQRLKNHGVTHNTEYCASFLQ